MQNAIEIYIKATPVFYANQSAYLANYPIIVNEGGSRSGKTYSIVQLLIYLAINTPGLRISIVSHSLPHIKRGALRDFQKIMQEFNIWNDNSFKYTDFVYTFDNGSYIELFGLEDESKARGPGRDVLFVNEANLIGKPLFDQLAMRTTGQTFLDLNPADFNCWCYDIADNPKNKKIHSTYRQNLENLSVNQISLIESYKDFPDDFMYNVYALGLRGAAKELIYTNWKMVKELPGKGDVIYGLDFGFTAPCAMVRVEIYDGSVYCEEVLYRSGMTISDLGAWLKTIDIGRAPIYADAAEPKSIEELYRYGFNIHKADKDVWAGILKVKSMPLHVMHTSENIKAELGSYKWRKDKNDNVLEEPVKMHDHILDALRYAVFTHFGKPKIVFADAAY